MHPNRPQRPSRRSACDRCRNYKLRCERTVEHDIFSSCDRCIRSGASCATTTGAGADAGAGAEEIGQAYQASHTLAGAPVEVNSSGLQSASLEFSSYNPPDWADVMMLNTTNVLSPPDSDNVTPDGMDTWLNTPEQWNETFQHRPGTPQLLISDGKPQAAAEKTPGTAASPRGPGKDDTSGFLDISGELFHLCSQLSGELTALVRQESHSPQSELPRRFEAAVQACLSGTSRLSDIVRCLKADVGTGQPSASAVNRSCPSATASQPKLCVAGGSVLLTTSLVSAYTLVIRLWRHTYSWLLRALLSGASAEVICELLAIPNLQLGGYRFRTSSIVQVEVLFELSSSMLRHIEQSLGMSSILRTDNGDVDENSRTPVGDKNLLSFSLQSTLLSQEAVQTVADGDGLSLKQIMEEVRRRLGQLR
ncbi:hypothetical protein F5Y17DRAFT_452393 [Xylariaceae sp. FL0594]|nr:hypothetical protein F5Y17DRAFT_452393 [Xylariaceae sp. FL0594]